MSVAERKIRWGILSTARIGRGAVIPAIRNSSNGELIAVASRDLDRAKAFAAENGIPKALGSYEALLADDEVDAVYIPLPNHLHYEWTIKAAEAGKHVLCEKPLALNAAQAAEMEDAARRYGVRLMEAFMYRFHSQHHQALDLIRSGAIGEPGLIRAGFTFVLNRVGDIRLQPEMGGGALMDVGCYCVSASRLLAGAEPVEVQAFQRLGETGVDIQLIGQMRFAGGLLAQFDCGFNLDFRNFYQVIGTDGYVEVLGSFLPGTGGTAVYQRKGRRAEQPETVEHMVAGVDQYQLMVEHFDDSILNNTPLRYPASDAVANMRVIDALYRSARNGGKPELVS